MTELWREIPNYPNYEASTLGNIRNKKTGRILKASIGTNGYRVLNLRNNGKTKCFNVHTLIARTWLVNDDPKILTDIHHKDCNKSNNRLDNLQYVSHAENIAFGTNHKTVYTNFTVKSVMRLMNDYCTNDNAKEVAYEIVDLLEEYFGKLPHKNNIEYR